MKKEIGERKECCPLHERGENKTKEKCPLLIMYRGVIRQLKEEELKETDLQKMCGG